jgi:hypothetical protein
MIVSLDERGVHYTDVGKLGSFGIILLALCPFTEISMNAGLPLPSSHRCLAFPRSIVPVNRSLIKPESRD